jgi:hypothetical protein
MDKYGYNDYLLPWLRAILCKDQRTIKVLRNSMSQNMLIFTSYVTYGILNSNIDMKIGKKMVLPWQQIVVITIFVHSIL